MSIAAAIRDGHQAFKNGEFRSAVDLLQKATLKLAEVCACRLCIPALGLNTHSDANTALYVPVLANVLNVLSLACNNCGLEQAAAEVSAALLRLLKQHEMATDQAQLNNALMHLKLRPDAALISARKIKQGTLLGQAKYVQGLALVKLGQLREAILQLQQAGSGEGPVQVYARHAIAEVHYSQRNYEATLASLDEALACQKKYQGVSPCNMLILQSKAYNSMGKYKEGRKSAELAAQCGGKLCQEYLDLLLLKSASRSSSAKSATSSIYSSRRSKSNELNISQVSDIVKKYNKKFHEMLSESQFEGVRVNERHVIEAMKQVL